MLFDFSFNSAVFIVGENGAPEYDPNQVRLRLSHGAGGFITTTNTAQQQPTQQKVIRGHFSSGRVQGVSLLPLIVTSQCGLLRQRPDAVHWLHLQWSSG